jgi:hypothetical protein
VPRLRHRFDIFSFILDFVDIYFIWIFDSGTYHSAETHNSNLDA